MALLMIAGPPASGKGTLCEELVEDCGFVHISGGDLLRAEIKQGTALGKAASAYMAKGALVPDELITKVIFGRLNKPDVKKNGALLDGFPRTKAQAESLKKTGLAFAAMIVIEVDEALLLERSAGRRLDPVTGHVYHLKHMPPPPEILPRLVIRPDDTEEKEKARIAIYNASKADLVDAFHDIVVTLDGNRSIPEVLAECKAGIAKKMQRPLAAKL